MVHVCFTGALVPLGSWTWDNELFGVTYVNKEKDENIWLVAPVSMIQRGEFIVVIEDNTAK